MASKIPEFRGADRVHMGTPGEMETSSDIDNKNNPIQNASESKAV